MLTGDHPDIARVVADELGIDEWRAEVLPEEKLEVVRELQNDGYVVGMVGDGINDAPALAAADIGIAMGLAGTDVAVETADVALANDDLHRLLDVRDLGARAVDVIRENYGCLLYTSRGPRIALPQRPEHRVHAAAYEAG